MSSSTEAAPRARWLVIAIAIVVLAAIAAVAYFVLYGGGGGSGAPGGGGGGYFLIAFPIDRARLPGEPHPPKPVMPAA